MGTVIWRMFLIFFVALLMTRNLIGAAITFTLVVSIWFVVIRTVLFFKAKLFARSVFKP
jgi:hypothetical protein